MKGGEGLGPPLVVVRGQVDRSGCVGRVLLRRVMVLGWGWRRLKDIVVLLVATTSALEEEP
jgi:hypothetical protein